MRGNFWKSQIVSLIRERILNIEHVFSELEYFALNTKLYWYVAFCTCILICYYETNINVWA